MTATTARRPAAHPDDPTPCEGPQDAVRIYDRWKTGDGVLGCVHHGARMLASVVGGLVYPGPSSDVGHGPRNGAAVDAYKRAQTTRPFPWMLDVPRTHPSQPSVTEQAAKEN